MRLQIERYIGYLDKTDLTEAQKEELLRALWLVVQGFVDRSFAADLDEKAVEKDGFDADEAGADALFYQSAMKQEFEEKRVRDHEQGGPQPD